MLNRLAYIWLFVAMGIALIAAIPFAIIAFSVCAVAFGLVLIG